MPQKVSSIDDLIKLADVRDIQFYELSGRLYSGFEDSHDEGPTGSQDVSFKVRLGRTFLALRLRLQVNGEAGVYLADGAVIFKLQEAVEPVSSPIMQQFIEREAFPVLYPFVRQALYDVASRLGAEVPVLGLLRVDDFDLQLQLAIQAES